MVGMPIHKGAGVQMSFKPLAKEKIRHTVYPDFHERKELAGKHTEDCMGCAYNAACIQIATLDEDLRFYKNEWENACSRAEYAHEEVKSLRAEIEELKKGTK